MPTDTSNPLDQDGVVSTMNAANRKSVAVALEINSANGEEWTKKTAGSTDSSAAGEAANRSEVCKLRAALGVFVLTTFALAIILGVVVQTERAEDVALEKEVDSTRVVITGGEDYTEEMGEPTLTPANALSSDKFMTHFYGEYEFPEDDGGRRLVSLQHGLHGRQLEGDAVLPGAFPSYHAGVDRLTDPDTGETLYDSYLEVLEGGAATMGEYADRYGQVQDNVMRTQVKIKYGEKKGDRFYLVPMGMSMAFLDSAHNQTRRPDFFYFSYQKKGTKLEDRIVTFCLDATFRNDVNEDGKDDDDGKDQERIQCFNGKGEEEWKEVEKWTETYLYASDPEMRNSRPIPSSYKAASPKRDRRRQLWGEVSGRNIGEKVGSNVGGKMASGPGAAVGESVESHSFTFNLLRDQVWLAD